MKKRWLLAPLILAGGLALTHFLTRPEQAAPLPPSSAPLAIQSIEEKVENPVAEEKEKPTGYMLLSPETGLTFKSRFGGEHTYTAKYFIGPGTDQISTGLTEPEFYEATEGMGKTLEVYALLNLPRWKITLGNRLADANDAPEEKREPHETEIMKRDILRNWDLTSQIIIDQGVVPGYGPEDTEYITSTLGQDGALRDSYSIDTMARFVFTPGADPESGSISITDYELVTAEDGSVTSRPMEDLGTRTYADSPRGSFRGWFNGTMLRTIYDSERLDDEGPSAQLIGTSHAKFGFDRYQTDTSTLASN